MDDSRPPSQYNRHASEAMQRTHDLVTGVYRENQKTKRHEKTKDCEVKKAEIRKDEKKIEADMKKDIDESIKEDIAGLRYDVENGNISKDVYEESVKKLIEYKVRVTKNLEEDKKEFEAEYEVI